MKFRPTVVFGIAVARALQMLVSDMSKAIKFCFLLLSFVFFITPLGAAENSGARSPADIDPPVETGSGDQWLDAVRAQRRAWEERRQASREATDARRRYHSPRAEALHLEQKRRRDTFLEQIERDREYFLGQGPWQTQAPPAPPNPEASPDSPNSPLPGWDNRWYFRGY
ncbi:MAG: hypothetical protein KA125_06770 [Chromatiaceae bacterium]|nr:hypothetical protein [Chromatiaceae bacterium]